MEVTLDIGKNIVNEIKKIASHEKNDFDIVALKILDLGLRVYQSSNNQPDPEDVDPLLVDIFKNALEANFLIKEVIGHVFVKDRSSIKAYDHLTAINVSENMAKAYIKAKGRI